MWCAVPRTSRADDYGRERQIAGVFAVLRGGDRLQSCIRGAAPGRQALDQERVGVAPVPVVEPRHGDRRERAPGPLDQLLRAGDERVGPPEVVAQDVEQVVHVDDKRRRGAEWRTSGACPTGSS